MKHLVLLCAVLLAMSAYPQATYIPNYSGINGMSNDAASQVQAYSITHVDLHIDTIRYASQQIFGHADLTFLAGNLAVDSIVLDLLHFTIDSLVCSGHALTSSYNDTVLVISLSPSISPGDSAEIGVYYHGVPTQDVSGIGGFYFSGTYAFSIGAGYDADPHSFGRAWMPCQDNFVTKSTYDFYITTPAGYKAFCNGLLQQSINNPDGTITWHWKQNQKLPSYLVGMAVAPFYTLSRMSSGIPVEYATMINDTINVLGTFSNLDTMVAACIDAYGPYPFDKIGFCLVPFNYGGMEHASSIHFGRAFANGSQTYATAWAHEFAHMWWGDKVTCSTVEDIWLNEGFATYNEAFYTKLVSGETAYRDMIRTNHRKVLQFAHTPTKDGSYLTMNNIPHDYTYGAHANQKAESIIHTMKYYMGEQNFSDGCKTYMNNLAYSSASSYDLRDQFSLGSGINMNRFFDDWIFTPGFPHFSIDSVVHVPGGLDHMYVYTRQRTKGNNNHLYEMPIDITFTDGVTDTTIRVVIDSVTNVFHIPIYFAPVWTILDRYGAVCDARVTNEKVITIPGTQPIAETGVSVNVLNVGSPSSTIRVEHNFVPPDPFIGSNPGIRLSDYRYWKVDGIMYPGFSAKGIFTYDGSISASTGYLDNTLITGTEDSLVILYRVGAGYEWNLVNAFTRNPGGLLTDKKGTITVDTLLAGEYTLGYYDYTVGIHEVQGNVYSDISVSPNPSHDFVKFEFKNPVKAECMFEIFDQGGRIIFTEKLAVNSKDLLWNCSNYPSGFYYGRIIQKNSAGVPVKFVIEK